jgi:3-hydroxyethyl bacteriochlorophyllide a dehydrogenase
MMSDAVVFEEPGKLALRTLELSPPGADDLIVDIAWSGISTGTEKLLWTGKMPPFPGLGYPLVPGYESVGRVVRPADGSDFSEGDTVFVPGASCYGDVRGLFGGASRKIVVPAKRVTKLADGVGRDGVLLALAATAHHAIVNGHKPDLIVGHGVLGRLLARVSMALGGAAPTVWETDPRRTGGARGYTVTQAERDETPRYRAIYDVSGAADLLDTLIGRLEPGGEVTLAGFYDVLSFKFVPAFLREARLRVAAEWKPDDLKAVNGLVADGSLSLDGLITHAKPATAAVEAYETAFGDAECLKMILDWSEPQ